MIEEPKILIVDDKQENLFALHNILSNVNAELIKATSGNDALKQTLNHKFALAILDIQMPEMDGYELAKLLRGEDKTKHIPIIFLSAVFSDEFHVFKGYKSGAVDFLTKPYNPEILQHKVKVFVELDRQKREIEKNKNKLEDLVKELKITNEQLKHEIAERKIAEEALFAEKENLAVTLRAIGDGVITTDTDGKIVLINEVAENLTGLPQGEAIGKPIDEIFHIFSEKTHQPCDNLVQNILKTSGFIDITDYKTIISRDGTKRMIAFSGAPVRDKLSSIIGVVLVFSDVTETLKLEKELQKSRKLESIGILAGGIAHDFNNLLTGILGNISLAKMEAELGEELHERLFQAETASLRAKDLTQQLLTFSKGGVPVKKTISIIELMKDSTSFALSGSNVKCKFSTPDDLWPAEVDEGQMSRVIHNIIINANDAMTKGGEINISAKNITIDKEENPLLGEGKYVKMSIEDQGPGISEEHLSIIFDPYFTTKGKGNGLGLAICHSIIKKHKGLISAESELGAGTTFNIYLPASPGKTIKKKDEEEEESVNLDGKGKVLVMDDEEAIREMACNMLGKLGYDAESVEDGAKTIDLYLKAKETGQPFDAVIMDVTIPGGMGGREAIKKLIEIDPGVKSIVSSGYSNDPIMADFKKFGFKGVLPKPYLIKSLGKTLKKVINDR